MWEWCTSREFTGFPGGSRARVVHFLLGGVLEGFAGILETALPCGSGAISPLTTDRQWNYLEDHVGTTVGIFQGHIDIKSSRDILLYVGAIVAASGTVSSHLVSTSEEWFSGPVGGYIYIYI